MTDDAGATDTDQVEVTLTQNSIVEVNNSNSLGPLGLCALFLMLLARSGRTRH